MKKLLIVCFSLMIGIGASAFGTINVDEKLVQSFKLSFPEATEVVWYELPEMFVVHFMEEGIRSRIFYWKDGSAVKFIRYYHEQNLPLFIRYNIKRKYPGKTIFAVIEVSTISESMNYSTIAYDIKLEDAKNWTTVRVNSDGTSGVVEKFRKL